MGMGWPDRSMLDGDVAAIERGWLPHTMVAEEGQRGLERIRDDVEQGLPYVELTTDPGNIGSQRAIEVNGAVIVEHFHRDDVYGGTDALRYRIGPPPA